ncbi:excisionase family DNA-binding protein [Streptomyces sp. t39]|uniref:excisionase family DNA-binding protein n=1 Tax=Streptomyces sp. t39 TaxID=1828156 RepID=UPI0011CD81DE|nr:excisionase family DNA-binding protein [Streptomyces sp. t39]TXS57789.1 helix-turn-helix domain-containing protein [Streptomyces sp. t39]
MEERYLSVRQFAELLGTTERFPRRLVAERRIRYVKFGTHVRFPESVVREYIEANTVEPLQPRRRRSRRAA